MPRPDSVKLDKSALCWPCRGFQVCSQLCSGHRVCRYLYKINHLMMKCVNITLRSACKSWRHCIVCIGTIVSWEYRVFRLTNNTGILPALMSSMLEEDRNAEDLVQCTHLLYPILASMMTLQALSCYREASLFIYIVTIPLEQAATWNTNIFFNLTIEHVLSSCEWYWPCFWCSSGRLSVCMMTLHTAITVTVTMEFPPQNDLLRAGRC